MSTAVQPIPDGYQAATPYLIVANAAKAIEFYKQAFGAAETVRMAAPGGKIMHAEIKIRQAPIMLADECPEWDARSPRTLGGSPVGLLLYVEDVDSFVQKATAAGATLVKPVQDQFYGDRTGTLVDPFGHKWTIATHKEDVSPEEMQKRFGSFSGK
jgi:PhnB protein